MAVAFTAEEKERSIELGRKLFDKEAKRYGLNLKQLTEPETMARVLTEYGMGKVDELYAALGYGKLAPKTVLAKFVPQAELKEAPPEGGIASNEISCRRPVAAPLLIGV